MSSTINPLVNKLICAGDGSASNLGIAFGGGLIQDSGTGFFQDTPGQIAVACNGAEVFRFSPTSITLSQESLALTATTNQLILGTTKTTTITAPAPATSAVYTIPDVGTVASFVMNAGTQTVAGVKTFSSALGVSAGITGTATNDSAGAGIVGQVLSASRLKSVAAAATTATSLNVTAAALSLTAGDWDVSGAVGFLPDATTSVTILQAGISKTTATLPAADTLGVPTSGEVSMKISTAANVMASDTLIPLPTTRISLASTTSIFLVANATFSVSTLTVYGSLNARRVR